MSVAEPSAAKTLPSLSTQCSAVVVTLNEDRRLEECLARLKFCEELVVIDLGSTDRSVQIAAAAGARVVPHHRVAIGEVARESVIEQLRNDWVLIVDPDEILPTDMQSIVDEAISREPDSAGIMMPYRYFFLGKPVQTTIWSAGGGKPIAIHRRRVSLGSQVHAGYRVEPGFEYTAAGRGVVDHYWVDSFRQLFEKHTRYIGEEGRSRFEHGDRFSMRGLLRHSAKALSTCLIQYHGWRGGWRGWFLSLFYTAYVARSWLSLRRFQGQIDGAGAPRV